MGYMYTYLYIYIYIYIYTRNTARASRALSFLTKPWDKARCFLQAPRLGATCEGQKENI